MACAPPSINSLEALGFSSFFAAQWDPEGDLVPGRVVAQHRGEWDVATPTGSLRAILAGRLYEERGQPAASRALAQPAVGDWVLLSQSTQGQLHVIERVLTRRTQLVRGAAGRRTTPQVIVANVDLVVVVCALSPPGTDPDVVRRGLNPKRIERYLAAVTQGGADAAIVLNKADLHEDARAVVAALGARFAPYPVITTSATTPNGHTELGVLLDPGKTIGLVGLSGTGKSSLARALLGDSTLRTGAVREVDGRGRHTTVHRELFMTPSGALLIDTPGMREFALAEEHSGLDGFEDVIEIAAGCRFRDCRHRGEPGCAATAALARGELSEERLLSYLELAEELHQKRAFYRKRARDKLR